MNLDAGYFSGVAPFGTPDYYALLFCQADARTNMRVLLALERLLSQISCKPMEPAVREARLGWWAAEMERLSEGKPAHPVVKAAHGILASKQLSPAPLLALFAAIVRETGEELPGTPDELLEHAGTRGAIIPLIAAILDEGQTRQGECSDPFEEIGRARFIAINLGSEPPSQPGHSHTPDSDRLMAQLALRQKEQLDAALVGIPVPRRARFTPLLVMAALLSERLGDMVVGKVAGKVAGKPAHLASLMRAWRCARRASRGKLPV